MVAGAVMLASLGTSSAFGQQKHSATADAVPSCSPNCTQADVDRAIRDLDARTKAAKARGAEADRKGAAAAAAKECGDFLLKGVANKKWTQPQILAEAGGRFTSDNVCLVARKHGYEQRAAL
jgi:hypothetical protein